MKRIATIDRDGAWLVVRFPYHRDVVADLKDAIPPELRRWDAGDKVWLVAPAMLSELRAILADYFEVRGPEPERPPAPRRSDFDELLAGLPLESLRRVYRAVMREVHPDRGGSTGLAQRVNAAWARIEARLASGGAT